MLDRHDALRPGTVLEGYLFQRILGAGGFGITYFATEELLERPVAIKEFLPSGIAHREKDRQTVRPMSSGVAQDFAWGLARFRDEARTLVNFTHPNIVPVLRYFEANGTGYLVMAFEKGQSLGQLLHPNKTLEEDEIREIAFPLLDGLKAIHARGFLHRDIKPDNIFIREDGSPVLLDFGAARQAISQHSRGLTAIVTPGYAPAEQYESSSEQGAWSDIYALGGVLYRCAVGERPLEATARMSAHYRGRADPMRPASQAAAGRISPVMLAAIDAALAVDGQARPQTADEFAALLRGDAVPGAPVAPAARPGAGRPAQPSTIVVGETSAATRRGPPRRGWRWAVVAVVAMMLLGGGYYGYAEYRARQEQAAVIKRQVDEYVAKARAAMSAGRWDEAQRHLDDAAKIDSTSDEVAAARKSLEDTRGQTTADTRRRAEEAERRAREEAARRKEEEERRKADEAKRRAEEDARRKAEDERRRLEEEARRKADEDAKRRADESAAQRAAEAAESVRQRIREARTALAARRYLDAKRAAEAARAAADLAASSYPNSNEVAAALRDARALQDEIRAAAAQYRATLIARARQALDAKRLDEAKRAIDEAEQLEPGDDIAALRRDYAALERGPGDNSGDSAARLVSEILRKVNRREPENGFCATTGWPAGSAEAYTQWLENAVVGSSKTNTFKSGADCQYDRVTAVTSRDGRKCVRYIWSACQRGKNCGRGTAEACKQANGNWETRN